MTNPANELLRAWRIEISNELDQAIAELEEADRQVSMRLMEVRPVRDRQHLLRPAVNLGRARLAGALHRRIDHAERQLQDGELALSQAKGQAAVLRNRIIDLREGLAQIDEMLPTPEGPVEVQESEEVLA